MHEVLVNRLGGLSLPRKSVVRLTDRPDMTLDVYRGRKTTTQQQHLFTAVILEGSTPVLKPNLYGESMKESQSKTVFASQLQSLGKI